MALFIGKKRKYSELYVPLPGSTNPLSPNNEEKTVNRSCQRCLGFKSILEEKTTFDIPLTYFDIYLRYSSVSLVIKLQLGMRIKLDEGFQIYPYPKYFGNTYLQCETIHSEVLRRFFSIISCP